MGEVLKHEVGSLCPAMKAAEMVGDKWVILILREMFLGSSRYNEFQRALPRISPTILSKRLKQLESDGLVIKKGGKSGEYRLTACGRELWPIIEGLATWGLRWARRRLSEEDIDSGTFMWDFHRTLNTGALPDGETVICISLSDRTVNRTWWMAACDGTVELCVDDPGKDVDLYVSGTLETIAGVWMGDTPVLSAVKDELIVMNGAQHLARTVDQWFPKSMFAEVRPERMMA